MAFQSGAKLKLPEGTPREYPPYGGATKNWAELTLKQVRRIKRKAPGVVCATYEGHGRTGEPWGIDVMVSPFNKHFNTEQEKFGWDLVEWLVSNWTEMNINYIIYDNLMNDGNGWFSYEPYRKQWPSGSQNLVSSRHRDHVHIQIDDPNVVGNE